MTRILALILAASPVAADPPDVIGIEAIRQSDTWRFSVTLNHGDTGWDHYADGWRVELADGTVIGERPLAHPHVTEMPFTRSQSGIAVPEGTREVHIRARDTVSGWSGVTTPFTLPDG